jgi:hypothetical protein
VFRRRRREDADPAARDSSEDDYLAEDELPDEEDYQEYLEGEDDEADLGYLDEDEELGVGADEPAEDIDEESAAPASASGSGRSRQDLGDPATWTRLRDSAAAEPANLRSSGPWDSAGTYPQADRVDFGCMLIPVRDGSDVQVSLSEETGIMIGVVSGESMLQLQAFAAPRSSGLWAEVRPEIADEVDKAGGRSQEQDGPFGPELLAWITPGPEAGAPAGLPPQPLRFLGVDGPRWFLRGLISGPAAVDAELARPLEDAFGDVVVVRGDHAEPPRKPLDIHLPEQAQQLFEEQAAAEQQQGLPNPFERGPEITETR